MSAFSVSTAFWRDDAVEMDVGIEQGAKTMDEGDGADPRRRTRIRASPPQTPLHRAQEE